MVAGTYNPSYLGRPSQENRLNLGGGGCSELRSRQHSSLGNRVRLFISKNKNKKNSEVRTLKLNLSLHLKIRKQYFVL